MKTMLFISRHKASPSQHELAALADFKLVEVGDLDAFDTDLKDQIWELRRLHKAEGVACVHPCIAMAAMGIKNPKEKDAFVVRSLTVGVFNNIRREDGGFETTEMVVVSNNSYQEERMGLAEVPFFKVEL